VALISSTASVSAQPAPGVGPLVQLSAGSPFAPSCARGAVRGYEVEPTATFAAGSGRLVAAWQADRATNGAAGIVAATSPDGGLTWTAGVVRGLSRCSGGSAPTVSDPWLTSGPDGTVYLGALTVKTPPHRHQATSVVVARSLDGGQTWQPPVTVARDRGHLADKPTMTADPNRPGVAYATWTVVDGSRRDVVISRTIDGGLTWSKAKIVARPRPNVLDLYPEIAAEADGKLLLIYSVSGAQDGGTRFRFHHEARVSADAGASWSRPRRLDRFRSLVAPISQTPSAVVRSDPGTFSLAAGPGGALLVTATIDSFRSSRIVLSQQRPDGSWMAPRTIARVGELAFLPTVAVSGSQQAVVTWSEISSTSRTGRLVASIEAAVSLDGGQSWQTEPLATPFDPTGAHLGDQIFFGDYQALTATPAGFEAVYARTPTATGDGRSDIFAQAIAP
jgi:hypothetical protein